MAPPERGRRFAAGAAIPGPGIEASSPTHARLASPVERADRHRTGMDPEVDVRYSTYRRTLAFLPRTEVEPMALQTSATASSGTPTTE